MLVVRARPPMYEEIVKVFPEATGEGVIFSWGRVIYNPTSAVITQALHEHECIHSVQQIGLLDPHRDPRGPMPDEEARAREDVAIREWWKRYLVDAVFRLEQELPAHIAEYRAYRKRHGDPHKVARYLDQVAHKLSSPLYGGIISVREARDALLLGLPRGPKVGANGVPASSG